MRHATVRAFLEQHLDDLIARLIAEQLALVLFMKGNAVFLYQGDEVLAAVASKGGAAESRVLGKEVARPDVTIGEVAATSPRDANFLGHALSMVDEQHAQTSLARLAGAEEPGSAGSDDDQIEMHGMEAAEDGGTVLYAELLSRMELWWALSGQEQDGDCDSHCRL